MIAIYPLVVVLHVILFSTILSKPMKRVKPTLKNAVIIMVGGFTLNYVGLDLVYRYLNNPFLQEFIKSNLSSLFIVTIAFFNKNRKKYE